MGSLFSKLGALAQQAANSDLARNVSATGNDMFGQLKQNLGESNTTSLLGAGALGSILGVLMTGKSGVGTGLLRTGGTVAAAALAWNFYQKWSQNKVESAPQGHVGQPPNYQQNYQPGQAQGLPQGQPGQGYQQPYAQPVPALGQAADPTALLVLEAMVQAARADGHIDAQERAAVHGIMEHLFPGTDVATYMDGLLDSPLNPEALACRVANPEQGRDLYTLSSMVIVSDTSMERAYLNALAESLGLSAAEKAQLDASVSAQRNAA